MQDYVQQITYKGKRKVMWKKYAIMVGHTCPQLYVNNLNLIPEEF